MRIRSLSVACALLLMTAVSSSAQTFPLDTVPTGATPFGVVVQASEMEGRKALRIELSEQTLRAGFGRGGYGDEPTYLALPVDFGNGVIEIDLYGKLNGKGPRDARAFVGLVYRADASQSAFESIYFRPTNGRKLNPGSPRDRRAVQYFAYPDWKFDRLRREFPDGRYESGAQIGHNEWFRVRLEIDGSLVKVYVNGALELTVPDMRLGASRRGCIGLFVDVGTEGYFSNLRVTPQ
jgi:hypothetical protein